MIAEKCFKDEQCCTLLEYVSSWVELNVFEIVVLKKFSKIKVLLLSYLP